MMTRQAPKTLYRYLFRELITIFAMSFIALSLLFLVVLGIQAVQGGYSLRIILPWMLEALPYSFFFTAPLSLIVASTLGYGRFVADREYTAAVACGVSPLHVFAPMLILATICCAIGMATQGTVLPHAHYKQRNITRYLVKQLEHLGDSEKGKLQIDRESGMVYWDRITDGKHLQGVHIEKQIKLGELSLESITEGGTTAVSDNDDGPVPPTYINAQNATLEVDEKAEKIIFTLYKVALQYPNADRGFLFADTRRTKFHETPYFAEVRVHFPINEKSKREGDWTNTELKQRIREHRAIVSDLRSEMPLLEEEVASASEEEREAAQKRFDEAQGKLRFSERRVKKARSEIWFRRALALSLFTFGFLGFPIAIVFRHNHKMVPFFIGIMLVVAVFYPLLLLGEALVKNQGLPASLCMLSGNLVLLAVGVFLSGKLVTR